MGPGISQVSGDLVARDEVLAKYSNNIFESSPDEVAFSRKFLTDLIFQAKNDIEKPPNIPEDNVIVDIISDPFVFTQVGTPLEAWHNVLAQLFIGSDSTKPELHQVLIEFFTFLNARPENILNSEDQAMLKLESIRAAERQKILDAMNRFDDTPSIDTEKLLPHLNDPKEFLASLPKCSKCPFRFHKTYLEMSNIVDPVGTEPDYAFLQLSWGLHSGELVSLLNGFISTLKIACKKIEPNYKIELFDIEQKLPNLSLDNSLSLPFATTVIGTTEIPGSQKYDLKINQVTCTDGRNIYILENCQRLNLVKLTGGFTDNQSRFLSYKINIPLKEITSVSLVNSGNYLYIIAPEIPDGKIYQISPFKELSESLKYESAGLFRSPHKITSPAVGDGEFIYCFNSKKISIFKIDQFDVTFIREVELFQTDTPLLPPFNKKLLSNKWMHETVQYASGNTFTFLIFSKRTETKIEYFSRSFSLIDGRHIGDSIFTIKFPILDVVCDPWNVCLWAVSYTPSGLSLVKLHMHGSQPSWLTGVPIANLPAFDDVQVAFGGVHNLTTAVVAVSNFLQYFPPHYVGCSIRAELRVSNFCLDTSNFFCPCTQRAVVGILDAIKFLKLFYRKMPESSPISLADVQRILISMLCLLQINLMNIHHMKLADRLDAETRTLLNEVLIDTFDKDEYEFAFRVTCYVIITCFPLVFIDGNARCASVFKRLVEKSSFNFVYAMLHNLQNDHYFSYCFTHSSCLNTFTDLLDNYAKAPNKLSQTSYEIITYFQRNLMIETRRMYNSNQGELNLIDEQRQATFLTYSRIICEKFAEFITNLNGNYNEAKLRESSFVKNFRKFLLLLQPLSKFARVAKETISILKPVFFALLQFIEKNQLTNVFSSDKRGFQLIFSILFEVFSVIIEFIMSLLGGGNELENSTQYLWLVRSTIEASINEENFKDLYEKVFSEKTSKADKEKLISLGIDDSKLIPFLARCIDKNESEDLGILPESFYSKQNKLFAKKTKSKTMRLNDILTIFALAKQFRVVPELMNIYKSLKEKGQMPAQVSYKMRGIMTAVNDVRNIQIHAKQKLKMSTNKTEGHKGKYGGFIDQLTQKLAFLLLIKPCYNGNDQSSTNFQNQLKVFMRFITENIQIDNALQLIKSAEIVKANISLGIEQILDFMSKNTNKTLVYFMIDKIVHSDNFIKYLSAIRQMEKETNWKTDSPIINKLMSYLSKLISNCTEPSMLNLMLIFYSNMILSLGKVDINTIFEPLSTILKIIYSNPFNLPPEIIKSYTALATASLYASMTETKETVNPELQAMIARQIFPDNKIDMNKLIVGRLFLSSGIKLNFNMNALIHFIKTISPLQYQSAFSFLYEYIKTHDDKLLAVRWLLKEISIIVTGGKPHFKMGSPFLWHATDSTEHVHTPGTFLMACNAMIYVMRKCLKDGGEMREIVTNLFNFILDYNMARMTHEVPKQYENFVDKRFVFGVFAVLSNSLDTEQPYSLIKHKITNIVYYITKVDHFEQCYYGWRLPITSTSVLERIEFCPHFVTKLLLPFEAEMYPDYERLIPYFKIALLESQSSYTKEALAYFILSSLSVYCSNQKFLVDFLGSGIPFQLSRYNVHDYAKDFIDILRAHLSTPSAGFCVPLSTSPRLSYCSMTNISDPNICKVTDYSIVVNCGPQSFISDPLDPNETTFLHLEFIPKTDFEVGLHFFSLHSSTSETFILNSDGEAIYNGCDVETIPFIISFTDVTLAYTPRKQKLFIYDGSMRVFTYNTPHGIASFILHTFSPCDVHYSIGPSPPANISMNESVERLCPSAGKTVFKRSKQKMPFDEKIKKGSFVQTNAQRIVPKKPTFQTLDDLRDEFVYDDSVKPPPIVSYPAGIIKKLGHTLKIDNEEEIKAQLLTFPTAKLTHTSNTGTKCPNVIYHELSHNHGSVIRGFPPTMMPVFVDDNSGDVTKLEDPIIQAMNSFLPLHPSSYSILPAEILNFYATGYVSYQRGDTQNNIFLYAVTSPLIGAKKAIEVFNIPLHNLIEFSLTLLLHIEPIRSQNIQNKECPIDFSVNALADNHHVIGANYIHKQAIDRIFKYIIDEGLATEAAKIWDHLLNQLFSDCGLHFVKRGQPHAIISQLAALGQPRDISDPTAKGFILFRAGFNNEGSVIIKEGKKEEKFSQGIFFVQSNSFTLIHGDAIGDGVVSLPVFPSSNESFFGTFFELATSYKYFIYFLSMCQSQIKNISEFKSHAYIHFIDSFIVMSPFFQKYGSKILEFLCQVLPLNSLDLAGEIIVRLSVLSVYSSENSKQATIRQFLIDQQTTINERVYLPLRAFFTPFNTEASKLEIEMAPKPIPEWQMPDITFPNELRLGTDPSEFAAMLMRMTAQRSKLEGFPFHLVMREWIANARSFPNFDMQRISDTEHKVTVLTQFPDTCMLHLVSNGDFSKFGKMKLPGEDSYHQPVEFPASIKEFYVCVEEDPANPINAKFFIKSDDTTDMREFIIMNKDQFVSDIDRLFCAESTDFMTDESNQTILQNIPIETFMNRTINTTVTCAMILGCPATIPAHIIALRFRVLLPMNWLIFQNLTGATDSQIRYASRMMPHMLKLNKFMALIDSRSNDNQHTFEVDRIKACDVRDGTSSDLSQTFIAQFAKAYKVVKLYRKRGDQPFKVRFSKEIGTDQGGIAKEFIVEALKDITLPTTGLFVRAPNAEGGDATNSDTFIPIASSKIHDPHKLYRAIGAILAISIRSTNCRDVPLAPFVWNFLATRRLTIEDIFSVDSSYRDLIASLEAALDMGMDDETFRNRFNLSFVVRSATGDEIALTELGRTKVVTPANCREFISLSNDYRLSEIRTNLNSMWEGLWENLDLKPPPFVNGSLIRYCVCGESSLTPDDLLKVTKFDSSVNKSDREQFIKILKTFSTEQCAMLLKFATAREKLPSQQQSGPVLIVDADRTKVDKCPTAATCFNQLHLPFYSSYEVARNLILKAITYTGTFENK